MGERFEFHHLSRYDGVVHGVTKKVTTQHLQGSLALHTGEPPSLVYANRKKLSLLYPSMVWVMAEQTHSDSIFVVENREGYGWLPHEPLIASSDALITNQKGVMLSVLTADCVPVLLYDPSCEAIGVVHAGWRGTAQEIVLKTVKRMQEKYGCLPEEIIATIAPSILSCCYEVDASVAQHFFAYPHTMQKKGEKYWLDLALVNEAQLLKAGLKGENIEQSKLCTSCCVDHFFSYRKEQGCSGRFMSFIGLI